jgi:DNA mismatch repair protein MutS2
MRDLLDGLEFFRIGQALADRASTFMGQEALRALRPKASLAEALAQQSTIAEALGYPYRLGGILDLRPALEVAREGKRLDGLQLLEVAHSLQSAAELKHELLEVGEHLSKLAARIGEHAFFLRRMRECIDETGNVKDNATPRLREIRRSLNPLRESIQDKLYALMDRNAEAIQDRLITIRRDRYVIPVKASFQNKISGIILDQSDTGVTVFMEPSLVVPLNNQLASLRLEEEQEIARVLFELSGLLANDEELEATLAALIELDVARAGAALAEDWKLCRPRLNQEGQYRLSAAWHPLIQNAVANDLSLNSETRILMLTGPNMGGKTALLKTLGLAVLMAQCGLYVAAQGAELAFPDQIFVDIGDQQSLQESLSTFAAHLLKLKATLEQSTQGSLVLIDELGSGTDPEEGASLSQAFVEGLLQKGVRGLITTHLSPLKAFAQETPGLQNASMRFDLEQLRPTYQLLVGSPGRSYALSIARRLGFPAERVGRAEELLGPEGGRLERLLSALEAEREQARQERASAEGSRRAMEKEKAELEAQLLDIKTHRERYLEEARLQAESVVREAQEQIRRTREKTKQAGPGQAVQELLELRSKYHKPARVEAKVSGLESGALVDIPEYGQGRIVELRGSEAVVQLGAVRLTLPLVKLQAKPVEKANIGGGVRHKASVEAELNLRGLTVEEALLVVDDYLAEARATGTNPVRLLHGKGTGALRNALREALRRDKRVASFNDAVPYEGGHGVTVVHLKG